MSGSDNGYASGHTALLFVIPTTTSYPREESCGRRPPLSPSGWDISTTCGSVCAAARAAAIPIFIVPHRRWEAGSYESRAHPSPYQLASGDMQTFAKGSWGGEWHPDFEPRPGDTVVREHFGASGFANTDLNFQLRQRGIRRVIVIGLLDNTCIETTARSAAELGYHVTLVKDATAAFSDEAMHSAHELNGPAYSHAILTTEELLAALRQAGRERPPVGHAAASSSSPTSKAR